MHRSKSLAVEGGNPVRAEPFSPWPHYAEDEVDAVAEVLRSGRVNYWTGETVRSFERNYAEALGVRHAIALANGTVALELALRALDIGPGDEVVVTSRTFVASASCIVAVGARPVFADVDPVSQNVTAETIEAVLSPRTRAVILVHLAGWPCDFDSILPLTRRHGLKVVEDCAQAHGALYRGRPVGSFGDAAAFSFCQDKIITTGGEGGLLVTDDEQLWKRAWSFKDHGKNPDKITTEPPGVEFRWLHDGFGTNLRMTAMQAAIGIRQLDKLDAWHTQRKRNATALFDGLDSLPALHLPRPGPEVEHAFYKFYAFLKPEQLKPDWSRNRILTALRAEGIPASSGSCSEIYLEGAFEQLQYRPDRRLPCAMQLGETSIMLPVHPTLTEGDMNDVVAAFRVVFGEAAG